MNGFIADEHIPRPSILLLRDAGYRVISIREEYPSVDDEVILELAESEGLVIITNDRDFGELIFKNQFPFSAGIIYCRLVRFRPAEIGELILMHITEVGSSFSGKLTVLSRENLRQQDL